MTDISNLRVVNLDEYNPENEATLVDLAKVHGVSVMTAKKRLTNVVPTAKLTTGKAGRPPVLFNRSDADRALRTVASQKQARAESDAVMAAVAEASATAIAE